MLKLFWLFSVSGFWIFGLLMRDRAFADFAAEQQLTVHAGFLRNGEDAECSGTGRQCADFPRIGSRTRIGQADLVAGVHGAFAYHPEVFTEAWSLGGYIVSGDIAGSADIGSIIVSRSWQGEIRDAIVIDDFPKQIFAAGQVACGRQIDIAAFRIRLAGIEDNVHFR